MKTDIILLIDRSGSMNSGLSDYEGGINSFILDQKELEGDVCFTLITFDTETPCEVCIDGISMKEAGKFKLLPRSGTPLLDAVGMSITHVKERLLRQNRKPDLVFFMIVTDGEENQSKEWSKSRVKELIEAREIEGWRFAFLGANFDAFVEGGAMGFKAATTLSYSSTNSQSIVATISASSSNLRKARLAGVSGHTMDVVYDSLNYTDEQREAAKGVTTSSSTEKKEEEA